MKTILSVGWRKAAQAFKTMTCLSLLAVPVLATDYYIDSVSGQDTNNGTTTATPWKTLTKVNSVTFQPGDHVMFKRGGAWTGNLHILGTGSSTAQLVFDAYGTGAAPIIDGGGAAQAIQAWNKQYMTIQNLDIANNASSNAPRDGILLVFSSSGVYSGIKILNNDIHNVCGASDRANLYSNASIYIQVTDDSTSAQIDGLLIQGNDIYDTKNIGIFQKAPAYYSTHPELWATGMVVRNNVFDQTGADDIVIMGANAPLIEHNAGYDAGINGSGYGWIAGMWSSYFCKDPTFQYNEVARVHNELAPNDGDSQAFDCDLGASGTNLFQYNYTHDNTGGVLIMMNESLAKTVVYRYNLSVNDDRQTNSGSQFPVYPVEGVNSAYIYNNVFYTTLAAGYRVLDRSSTYFYNNIFDAPAGVYASQPVFSNNCFFGHVADVNDPYEIAADPKFAGPLPSSAGGDGFGATTTDVFKLQSISPCINAGKSITTPIANGGLDFFGNPLYAGTYADIGIHEVVGGSKAPPSAVTFTDDAPGSSVVYTGSGWTHTTDSLFYGSTRSDSVTIGNSVQYSFTGTNVSVFGRRGPALGKINVSIDGGAPVLVDCYWTLDRWRDELFQATGLGNSAHTITITVAAKNPASSYNRIAIDYFQRMPGTPSAEPVATTVDNPASSVVAYSGTWAALTGDTSNPPKFYAGTRMSSSTVGSYVDFTFTGNGARIYGSKHSDYGKLSVSIDGGAPTVVDCYDTGLNWQYMAKLYEITGLASGTHTLRATIATKTAAATANNISIDCFQSLVGGSPVASADYQFGTSTATYASTDSDAGSTAGSMAFGAGITAGGISTTSGNPPNCLFVKATNNSTESLAISGNKYITCTITPGSTLSFKAISFDYYRDSSASAANFSVRSSADGYATTISSGTLTAVTSWTAGAIDLSSVTALQNVSTATTFRIYFWGGTDTSTPTRFDNIEVTTGP